MVNVIVFRIILFVIAYFYITTYERTLGLFDKYLQQCKTAIDFGSGSANGCYLPLLRERGIQTQLYDTHAYADTAYAQPIVYDGEHIPLPSKSVDACLALFSLHKSGRQNFMLQEMKRLARKYVLIIEDVAESGSRTYMQSDRGCGVSCYHSVSEWMDMFHDLGTPVVESYVLPAYFCPFSKTKLWYPVRKVAFVLKPE